MLALREPFSGTKISVAVAGGDMIRVGLEIPPDTTSLTRVRQLVVGDLLRRVLEDIHSAQVLVGVITNDHAAAEQVWRPDLMVRPAAGIFTTEAEAVVGLGKPLDLMITVVGAEDEPASRYTAVAVAPLNTAMPYPEPDLVTVRFVLACASRTHQLDLTSSLLQRAQAVLDRWRERVQQWSHYPSYPIPSTWRAAVIVALDDDLDIARVVAMLHELEEAQGIEPGAKFEAFAYVDRVLAVDLARGLGRLSG